MAEEVSTGGYVEEAQREEVEPMSPFNDLEEEFAQLSLRISVGEAEQRGSSWNKYTAYRITADPVFPDVLNVMRRYKDFVWLRQLLCKEFTGVFIPPLPEKKALGRFEEHFIETRSHDLERFLNRCSSLPFIRESNTFHMFLTRHEDSLSAALKDIQSAEHKITAPQKSYSLQNHFSEATSQHIELEKANEDALRLKEFLVRGEEQLTRLVESSTLLVVKSKQLAAEAAVFNETMQALDSVERNFPQRPEPDRLNVLDEFDSWSRGYDTENNGYRCVLLQNLKFELLDMRAFLEVIRDRETILAKFDKIAAKVAKWQALVDAGQTLSEKQQNSMANDSQELDEQRELLETVTKLVLFQEIQLLWTHKLSSYKKAMRKFATVQLEYSRNLVDVFSSMAAKADEAAHDVDTVHTEDI